MPTWLANLTSLNVLDLSSNHISGHVPVGIGALENLSILNLSNNSFDGVISEEHFSNLTSLYIINLSHNNLVIKMDMDWVPPFQLHDALFASCHLGPQFPTWFRWQKDIHTLDISNTSLLGGIPDWFWTSFSNSRWLSMSYNNLGGELPLNLEFMSMEYLYLQSNRLSGSVPWLPRSIKILDISRNSLNGQLSLNFEAPWLQVVLLFSNHITGVIPSSICQWKQLRVLDLSRNLLEGELPGCGIKNPKQWNSSMAHSRVASSSSLKIHTLLLSGNSLSGEFPVFLRNCRNLLVLDLAENNLIGKLPAWISDNLSDLIILRLRSNNFSSCIPVDIMRLPSLRFLDLANNTLSGTIPQSLASLIAYTTTDISEGFTFNPFEVQYDDNDGTSIGWGLSGDSLTVVTKGQELEYTKNAIYLMSIDLSENNLAGPIPEEIGSLIGLVNLNLSWNYLSGNIPNKINTLQALESLDLSNNHLSGEIPQGLSNLTSLSYLNLSFNDLYGRIPSGHQLDTLNTDDPTSMYIGNPSLCGHPLPKQCPGDQPIQGGPIRQHEDDHLHMDFYLSLSVGFVVGLWMVFCCLLFKKRWRHAYFRLLDKLYDRVYVFSVVTGRKWYSKAYNN
ncbi:hypothetical protein ACP70R_037802 [Stipagrostis hirtigluma subsp. patula]